MGKRSHGQCSRTKGPTSTYSAWRAMHKRCSDTNHPLFKNHGGRGIIVCARWTSFENFFADMGMRPVGLTLERKDNDKGYEPDNCVWASAAQQARNRRSTRLIEFRGETLCLKDWADRFGMEQSRLSRRLGMMDMERAVTLPVRKWVQKGGPVK